MRARFDFPHTFIVVSILAVAALITAFAFGPSGSAHDEEGDVGAAIYRSAGPDSHDLIPLDPRTLDDMENAESISLPVSPWSLLISRDGKVVTGIDNDGKLIVQNRSTGGSLAVQNEWTEADAGAFSVAGFGWPVALNADGSKVLVQLAGGSISWWKVFDTATGETLVEIREESGWSSPGVFQVDPVGWKLYHLLEAEVTVAKQEAPVSAQLVSFDLSTGAELGRTELNDVEIGAWDGDLDPDPNGNMPIHNNYIPGLAISPDGSELAIVHVTDDGVTLIDTASLTVSRTITMHTKTSLLGKVFAFIAPQDAAAKLSAGESKTAFYADGEHLYVSGQTSTVDGENQIHEGHGLSVVSLDDGEIERQTLEGVWVDRVVELSDGEIILTGYDYRAKNPNVSAQIIARLDAGAKDVIAERTIFPDFVSFVIVPAT
jgi:hypothetical protein